MRIQMRANAADESRGFEPLPLGEYILTCTGVEDKTTRTGRNMVVLELTVSEGQYERRKVWHNVTFIAEGEKGHGMMVHALHAFGLQYDGDLDFDTEEFRGCSCKATLDVEESEYDGRLIRKNVVRDFHTENHGSAAPPASAKEQLTSKQVAKHGASNSEKVPF